MMPVVLAWEAFKDWLAATARLTHWDLHVIAGVLVFLLGARLMRRPLRSAVPVVPVVVLEAGNELLDFLRAWLPGWAWNWRDTLVEIALTLAGPLLLILGARAWPLVPRAVRGVVARWRRRRRRDPIVVRVRDAPRR